MALLTFLVSVAWLPLPSGAFAPRWWVMSVGAALLAWTLKARMTPGHWLGAALLIWCAVQLGWGFSAYDELNAIYQLSVLAVVFCVGAEMRSLDGCYRALALGVSVSAAVAVLQTFGFEPVATTGGNAVSGLFLNHDLMAEAAVVAIIGVGYSRPLALGPLLALALAPSRGAMLALAVATALTLSRRAFLALGAVVGIAATAVLLGAARPTWDMRSILIRLDAWEWAASNLRWEGWGAGTYGSVFRSYGYLHNEYLQSIFELGLGAALPFALLAYALGGPRSVHRSVLAAILVEALVGFSLHAPVTAFLGALVAGHLCGERRRLRRATIQSRGHDGLGNWGGAIWRHAAAGLQHAGRRGMDVPARPGYARVAGTVSPNV